MEFRIADTFTNSLSRLTGEEQKLVKTTAFDLQLNPANPGHNFHRLDGVKDAHFWSVRVGRDIRLIVHRTGSSLLLCYVDHHDDAYRWAARRKLETHPRTGAAQMVQLQETIREIVVTHPTREQQGALPALDTAIVSSAAAGTLLFKTLSDDQLLSYGVPPDWLETVRALDEDGLLAAFDALPAEAAEALLELATGGTPILSPSVSVDPFAHPDALRRFRTLNDAEALAEALDYPWDKWAVFLHPAQADIANRDYSGPARVSGSAGTGKTVVALHRAVSLASRYPESHVLLTTFSPVLAEMLKEKVRRLLAVNPRVGDRLEVADINTVAVRLYESAFGRVQVATPADILAAIQRASDSVAVHSFTERFLFSEWQEVVDAWQIQTWEEYRDVRRLGRKIRLPETQRATIWAIFERALQHLRASNRLTYATIFTRLAATMKERQHPPFTSIIVDEAQDISISQLRFLAAVGSEKQNALFFAGDLGQRIFQTPFSWRSLGVDIRGRSRTLTINYRTSHQIRNQADRLLAPAIADVDGVIEERKGTISVFNGPAPEIYTAQTENEEAAYVAKWLQRIMEQGVAPDEIAVFVRSSEQFARASKAIEQADLSFNILDSRSEARSKQVTLSTMHQAKGLEFKAVAVMACDDEIIPLQERMEEVTDDTEIEDFYNTERHLLYVAVTRARDLLLVTSVEPKSEFIDDLLLV